MGRIKKAHLAIDQVDAILLSIEIVLKLNYKKLVKVVYKSNNIFLAREYLSRERERERKREEKVGKRRKASF